MMLDQIKHWLGIKTDADIVAEINGEPTIQKARRALAIAQKYTGISDDILEEYQEAEDARQGKQQ